MDEVQKTKVQLIEDLAMLRQRMATLENAESARAQAEDALRERDARTDAILQTTVDAIITIDEQGVIESFNPAAERLFGYQAAEVIGQNVNVLMPSPYREGHARYIAQYLATAEKKVIGIGREVGGLHKSGHTFPIELAVSEVRFNHQRLFTGIVRDISERKRLEAELLRASRMHLIGQLMSGIAHEIGTPLNVISGNAELLGLELRGRADLTVMAGAIVEQADRMTGLIQQLLSFARPREEEMISVTLHVPLHQALRLLETRFRREGITVTLDIPDNLPFVWGIADQLEQIFLNVLVNAWHAMPEGGQITIQADAADDGQVRIAFSDTGLGIAAEDLERVFEPFYSTKGERGTGLGLAICHQIVEAHQGAIFLSSVVGAGTTVTIALMQAHAARDRDRSTRPPPAGA